MLHAISQRKARLDVFRGAGTRLPLEDVVTSSVFGTLSLLRPADQLDALERVFRAMDMPLPAWRAPPQIHLWRKREMKMTGFRDHYIEPDVEISDSNGVTLLIEIKWGAPLGKRELSAQWLSLKDKAQKKGGHLLLTLKPGSYNAAIEDERITVDEHCTVRWPLEHRTWRDFGQACRSVAAEIDIEPSIRAWTQQVYLFLLREDPETLQGWRNLRLPKVEMFFGSFQPSWFSNSESIKNTEWRFCPDE